MEDDRVELDESSDILDAVAEASEHPGEHGETSTAESGETNLLERALRTAGSDAAKYLPVRFVPALTSLVTVPIFTSMISPSDYGAFFLISTAASFIAAFTIWWLQTSVVRFYWPAKREGRLDEYNATMVWTAVVSLAVSSAVIAVVVAFTAKSISHDVLRLVPIGILFYVFNFLTNTLVQMIRAANRAGTFAKLQVWGALVTTVLSIVFVWFGKLGSAGILAGSALGWAILTIPMLRSIGQDGSMAPTHVSRSMLRELLHYGLPLVPAGVCWQALVLIDRYVIGWFSTSAAVGLYSVAYSLGDKIMQLATMPLILTMVPSLIETFENRGQMLAEKVQKEFVRYFAMLTFPLIIGMAATAQPFMHVFTDRRYWAAWPVLALVTAGSMFASFANIATTGLQLHKKTLLIALQTVVAAGFNLVANIVLVPRFGYIAAAYNTVAAYFLLLGLAWWQSRGYMRLHLPWNALGRIVAACVGMGLVVWLPFVRLAPTAGRPLSMAILVVQVIAGVIVYFVLLRVFGAIYTQELRFLDQLWRNGLRRLRRTGE